MEYAGGFFSSSSKGFSLPNLMLIFVLTNPCGLQFPPTQDAPQPAARSASAPATQPGEFQPGVRIDWTARRVRVRCRVLDSADALEFFACGGGKEHESILLLEARAVHVFQALGLIGTLPGSPSVWDEATRRARPAEGDLVDLRVEWSQDGRPRDAHWTEWILDAEYLRRPLSLPFVFAGSLLRPDGRLACETSGAAVALVDIPDALLAPIRSHSDRSSDLWALANRAAIPSPGTSVTLVLGAPSPVQHSIALDARGEFCVDGRVQRTADVAELLLADQKMGLGVVTISVQEALTADVRRAAESLAALGVAPHQVRFATVAAQTAPSAPASVPVVR